MPWGAHARRLRAHLQLPERQPLPVSGISSRRCPPGKAPRGTSGGAPPQAPRRPGRAHSGAPSRDPGLLPEPAAGTLAPFMSPTYGAAFSGSEDPGPLLTGPWPCPAPFPCLCPLRAAGGTKQQPLRRRGASQRPRRHPTDAAARRRSRASSEGRASAPPDGPGRCSGAGPPPPSAIQAEAPRLPGFQTPGACSRQPLGGLCERASARSSDLTREQTPRPQTRPGGDGEARPRRPDRPAAAPFRAGARRTAGRSEGPARGEGDPAAPPAPGGGRAPESGGRSGSWPPRAGGAGLSRCAKLAAKGLAASGSVRYISQSR